MKISINHNDCGGCGDCIDVCPVRCIVISNGKATFNNRQCIACGKCIEACEIEAIKFIDETQESKVDDALWRRVVTIITEQLGVDECQIEYDSNIIDDLGADSLDAVELVMAFEEEFGAEIPDDDAERLTTPAAICQYLKAHGF